MPTISSMAREVRNKPAAVTQKKSAAQPKARSFLQKSNEFVNGSDLESDTDSDDDSEVEKAPAAARIPPPAIANGSKKGEVNPSSSSGSSSGGEEDGSGSESSSDESSEQSGSSSSGGEEEEESDNDLPSDPADAVRQSPTEPETPKPTDLVAPRPVQKYIPPKGFEILAGSKQGNPKASQFFKSSYLEGKQIWYITAPTSIPIASIKEVSMRDVQTGRVALSHAGQDYGFVQESADHKGPSKIALPDDTGKAYTIAKRRIDQTLHLQQLISLPNMAPKVNGNSQTANRATITTKKPIRQQPEGLKMRFRPIGFGAGKTGVIGSSSSDEEGDGASEEEETGTPQFKIPSFSSLPKSGQSNKMADTSSEEDSSESDDEMIDAVETLDEPKSAKVMHRSAVVEVSEDSDSSDDDEMVDAPEIIEKTNGKAKSKPGTKKAIPVSDTSSESGQSEEGARQQPVQKDSSPTKRKAKELARVDSSNQSKLSPIAAEPSPKKQKTNGTSLSKDDGIKASAPQTVNGLGLRKSGATNGTSSKSLKSTGVKMSSKPALGESKTAKPTLSQDELDARRLKKNEQSRLSKAKKRAMMKAS